MPGAYLPLVTLPSLLPRASRLLAPMIRRATLLSFVLLAVVAAAQDGVRVVTSVTPNATRTELTHRLDSLVQADANGGKASEQRARREEVEAIRTRLAEGDFQPADRFILDYGVPTQRPDTVLVRDSSNIALFNWPSYSLHGVLRSELQAAMQKYVGTYIREPRIRVYPLTRLTFIGGVVRPGAHPVDPARSLSDAIMEAGGTGANGKADQIEVYRGKKKIMNKKRVAQAIRDGSTIEQLRLESGDEVRVAQSKAPGGSRMRVQTYLWTIAIITSVIAFIRASYVP